MPLVYFMAWINDNSEKDPGHLVMLMVETGICFEYGRQGSPNYHAVMSEKFKPGDYEGENQDLKVIQEGFAKNIETQKKKQWGEAKKIRFTHVLITQYFEVTDKEFEKLKKLAALRIAVGTYNFWLEAREDDPSATRCLSWLDDLAAMRGQKLKVGFAEQMLLQFAELNKVKCRKVPVGEFKLIKVKRLRGG